MSSFPSGTVTFLFTDIEGSTKRWEQYPRQMQAALQRHDAIMRSAVEEQGGYVFKTMGDAFCAAFSSPHAALSSALASQLALSQEQWPEEIGSVKVRMALHTGAIDVQGGDYFGQPLNRVARLLSAGHGGQVLLSLATQELVQDALPERVTLRDMGKRRLKDLIQPERVFQVVVADFPSDFPPLRTLDLRPDNLPAQRSPLIGREKELQRASSLLRRAEVRLVTFTGPGGTGKTRLALQVAAELVDHFNDGVYFVNLASISDQDLVISTIGQTLNVKEAAGQPLIETLKGYLKEKEMLLLLDNFEQVVQASPQISQLLSAAPALKVLATSRVPLRVQGEKEFPVPPLAVPDTRHLPPIEQLTKYEAVRLFIERATDVKSDFEVNNDNAPAVAEVCRRLDGLPLAIELAAARVRFLPPQAMLSRLHSRLKLVTGGARDLPARQQTLRAAIEWSYDLLAEGEKQLFRRMAVFSGGRTLEALEAVCNSERLQIDARLQTDMLDGVELLLNNNLIQQREGSDREPRFWMLETIHEYAREKLVESGEGEVLSREHALYFMKLAEETAPHLTGARQQEWLERLEEEHDNFRASFRWANEAEGNSAVQAIETGLRTAGAIWRFWYVRGYLSEGIQEIQRLVSEAASTQGVPGSFKEGRATALNGAGALAYRLSDYASARSLLEEALDLGRDLGDNKSIALSLAILGNVATDQGDYSTARSRYEQSVALFREIGNKSGIASSLGNLGIVVFMQGDYSTARSLCEESVALFRELADKGNLASSLNNLGNVISQQGDSYDTRSRYAEALQISNEIEDKLNIVYGLAGLGGVAVASGKPQKGARLLGASDALLEAIDAIRKPDDCIPYDQAIASARAQLGEEAFEKAWQEGLAMSMEAAIAYALEALRDD